MARGECLHGEQEIEQDPEEGRAGGREGSVLTRPRRAFPSPSAHTFDGEAPSAQASGPSLALCLAWAPCLPRQQPEAPSSAG